MGNGIVARNGATRVDSGSHVLVDMDGVLNGLYGINGELELLWNALEWRIDPGGGVVRFFLLFFFFIWFLKNSEAPNGPYSTPQAAGAVQSGQFSSIPQLQAYEPFLVFSPIPKTHHTHQSTIPLIQPITSPHIPQTSKNPNNPSKTLSNFSPSSSTKIQPPSPRNTSSSFSPPSTPLHQPPSINTYSFPPTPFLHNRRHALLHNCPSIFPPLSSPFSSPPASCSAPVYVNRTSWLQDKRRTMHLISSQVGHVRFMRFVGIQLRRFTYGQF